VGRAGLDVINEGKTFLDGVDDDKISRTGIEGTRVKYDVEVVTKLIVYGGRFVFGTLLMVRDWMVEC
jgi:hypothetical protein